MAKKIGINVANGVEAVTRKQAMEFLNGDGSPNTFNFFDYAVNEDRSYKWVVVRTDDDLTPETESFVRALFANEIENTNFGDVLVIRKYRKYSHRKELFENIDNLLKEVVNNKDVGTRRKKVRMIREMLASLSGVKIENEPEVAVEPEVVETENVPVVEDAKAVAA